MKPCNQRTYAGIRQASGTPHQGLSQENPQEPGGLPPGREGYGRRRQPHDEALAALSLFRRLGRGPLRPGRRRQHLHRLLAGTLRQHPRAQSPPGPQGDGRLSPEGRPPYRFRGRPPDRARRDARPRPRRPRGQGPLHDIGDAGHDVRRHAGPGADRARTRPQGRAAAGTALRPTSSRASSTAPPRASRGGNRPASSTISSGGPWSRGSTTRTTCGGSSTPTATASPASSSSPSSASAASSRLRREYLELARSLTAAHGILLIFDEIISGFRFCPTGVQTLYGVRPDLSTFGKIIGGGHAVSAVVGHARGHGELRARPRRARPRPVRGRDVLGPLRVHEGRADHARAAGLGRAATIYPRIARARANSLRRGIEKVFAEAGIPVRRRATATPSSRGAPSSWSTSPGRRGIAYDRPRTSTTTGARISPFGRTS